MFWKILKDTISKFETGYILPNHWEKIKAKEKFSGRAQRKW